MEPNQNHMENIRNEMNVSNNQSNDNNSHELEATAPGIYKVIRRNGKVTRFDATKITVAITKAFLAVEGKNAAASSRIHSEVDKITTLVTGATTRNMPNGGAIHIEDIQDHVELALMRAGYQKIARSYVLYREQRAAERKTTPKGTGDLKSEALEITLENGEAALLDENRLITIIKEACEGLEETDASAIFAETKRSLFPGVAEKDVANAVAMSARTFIEKEPNYTFVAARLLLDNLRTEALTELNGTRTEATQKEMSDMYSGYFHQFIKKSIELELLDPRLGNFDLERLGAAIKPERDFNFNYLGMQTLYDRYFIKNLENKIILASYLHKYRSKRLLDLMSRLANKGISENEYEIVSSIILILKDRYRKYKIIAKNHSGTVSPELMDSTLYPSDIITGVKGANAFTIVNWKQLNIEINDVKPEELVFKKIINGIPSNHKVFSQNLSYLHLGMTTRSIIKIFGSIAVRISI